MAEGLCKYKDALGKPGEGAHALRAGGLAAVDVLATVGAAGAVAWWFDLNFAVVLLILIILSAFVHRAFCVDTPLTSALLGPRQAGPSARRN
jgi:hypothetical protein